MNFQQLGLVHLVLPKARIIHCRRNAADTCLSIYFTHFGALQSLACDRGSIAAYYRDYHRLKDHWRSVMPKDVLLEVEYEDLVANQERVTRQMIDFCGLDWDPSCLRPNANDRVIRTASMWQARQPVYDRSVGRWRNYEPWLGEFRSLIGVS